MQTLTTEKNQPLNFFVFLSREDLIGVAKYHLTEQILPWNDSEVHVHCNAQ